MDRGRTRKIQHMDQMQKYDEMEICPQRDSAVEAFNRPAYQSVSVMEYLIKKYKIGGDSDEDDKAEVKAVQSASEGAGNQ